MTYYGSAIRLSADERRNLPKAANSSAAIQHEGGSCPVDPLQPISVWWRNACDQQFWVPINTARAHDWTEPCVYRTREPKPGHPMFSKLREIRKIEHEPHIVTPMESIASDFTRLVDAIENYLARCEDAQP